MRRSALAVLATLCLPGCAATFASFDPATPDVAVAPEARPRLHLEVESVTRQFDRSGLRIPDEWVDGRDYTDGVTEAFRDCDCIASLVGETEPRDLVAEVSVTREAQNNAALLNLVTIFLIPGLEDRELQIEVELRDASGRVVRVERSARFRVWYELLFVPLYPWHSPVRFEARLEAWLFRSAVTEALGRMLEPTSSGSVASDG